MNEYAERLKPFYHFAEKILFPVILILFPLLKVNQGIDLTDTVLEIMCSLGKIRCCGHF